MSKVFNLELAYNQLERLEHPTKPKKFTDYYADPKFRKRHLKKMMEKENCECGFYTAKCNMSHHKKSRNHHNRMTKVLLLKYQVESFKDKINKFLN